MPRLSIALAVLIGLTMSMTAPASAQVIGFKLGPTFANVSVDDDNSEESTLTSFGGGGFIRFGLAGLSIQLEGLAVTKGAEIDGPGDDDLQLKVDYIEVPLLARFALGSGSFAPYVMAGPSVSFEIDCSVEFEFDDVDDSIDCADTAANIFERKSTDFGLTGVLGFEYRVGPGAILVEGRYTHGLTNISETNDDVKNRMFAVFAGYSISLRGF